MSAQTFRLRAAHWQDAAMACRIVRRSILGGCSADHENDPTRLAEWLRNKTPAQFARWLLAEGSHAWLALHDGRGLGFALLRGQELMQCYVSPESQGQGVGRALLRAAAGQARRQGAAVLRLNSTRSALGFYERLGLQRAGEPKQWAGLEAHPMVLALTRAGPPRA